MWLLENAGNAFQAGQLVISDKTISRKHLTIEVDRVRDGDGRDPGSRSVVTIEDLATKIGTVVNGTQIRGQKFVLIQDTNDLKMGHMPDLFRITWHPIVFSFSFSSKELRALPDPWQQLKKDLEPLDIKYIPEFDRARTTHVVAKKRNTSKGLQALINGDYIVTEAYIAAIVAAASSGEPSLESDFSKAWPSPLDHLPPRGDEPSDRPVSTYSPDTRRANIFEGYTFVFYDQKQFDTLLPPIAEGRGKALLGTVVPGQTEVDDFVRYVKGVAGEKGLGEFEDGSEGRGVVVVRHVPAKGDHVEWFTRFTTAVALRLDHRLIDQREFLDAVLAVEPSMLRRPLEVDVAGDQPPPRRTLTFASASASASIPAGGMDVDDHILPSVDAEEELVQRPPPLSQSLSQASSTRRARARRGGTASRFKGFDVDLDSGDEDGTGVGTGAVPVKQRNDEKDGMFMSQTPAVEEQARRNKRHPPDDEDMDDADGLTNVMDDIAPTAALVKRRRIEAGIDPVPARESPFQEDGEDDDDNEAEKDKKAKLKKGVGKTAVKKEKLEGSDDILGQARRNREAADEKRRLDEERERLAAADIPDDGIDAEAIRKLTLVETIQVREAGSATRTREQDIADGRWDPQWNGRRNFKKFRKQGDIVGRVPQRVIIGLEPAKTKEYGIGDDYWLEGGDDERAWRGSGSHNTNGSSGRTGRNEVPPNTRGGLAPSRRSGTPSGRVIDADDMDDTSIAGHDDAEPSESGDVPASRRAAAASTPSIPATNSTGSVRRPAPSTLASGSIPILASGLGSGSGSHGGESLGSGMVNLEIIPDTDPEDEHHGRGHEVASDDDDDDNNSLSVGTKDTRDSLAVSQLSDLPRTRAGKVASRPARQNQNQSQTAAPHPPAAATRTTRTTRTSRRGALPPSGDTGSSLFDSVQAPSTQVSDLRATRAKRAAPAPSARLQSPAKRPRRGAAADTDSMAASSAPIAISDSDDDDGLRFKFKSRR
ncbi:dna damage response protein [Ophiostoma piceae UAMH 11346]|uniref:Dna damage response protein n=1 Tax=Ophiostoma piceae (strain UAMH 11346) TaxID=1262450 RepID=S3D536_OPHP1|nr:dna damage response protein [Ophiostoma piceae UAMH 11346]